MAWARTSGVEFCDFCVDDDLDPIVDLRNAATPDSLLDDQLRLYRDIVRLIAPSETPSTIAPRELEGWANWELFDLVITLAMIMQRRFGGKRSNSTDMIGVGNPDGTWHKSLMTAGAAVAAWPLGMLDVIDLMMACDNAPSRAGLYGRAKWLGPLDRPGDYTPVWKVRFAITGVVDRFYPPLRAGPIPWRKFNRE